MVKTPLLGFILSDRAAFLSKRVCLFSRHKPSGKIGAKRYIPKFGFFLLLLGWFGGLSGLIIDFAVVFFFCRLHSNMERFQLAIWNGIATVFFAFFLLWFPVWALLNGALFLLDFEPAWVFEGIVIKNFKSISVNRVRFITALPVVVSLGFYVFSALLFTLNKEFNNIFSAVWGHLKYLTSLWLGLLFLGSVIPGSYTDWFLDYCYLNGAVRILFAVLGLLWLIWVAFRQSGYLFFVSNTSMVLHSKQFRGVFWLKYHTLPFALLTIWTFAMKSAKLADSFFLLCLLATFMSGIIFIALRIGLSFFFPPPLHKNSVFFKPMYLLLLLTFLSIVVQLVVVFITQENLLEV